MKPKILFFLSAFLFSFLFLHAEGIEINVLEPKAMTDVYITQQCLIRWQSVSVNRPLKVLLVRYAPNYKVYQTLAQNLGPSTTTFKWIVGHVYTPGDATIWPVPGDGFKIRVETIDGNAYGESGYIGIWDPLLTVTAPIGRTYHLNDTMIIRWNYNNKFHGGVDIELWKGIQPNGKGGRKIFTIAKNVRTAQKSYKWQVSLSSRQLKPVSPPALIGRTYYIRLRSARCPKQFYTTSGGKFMLIPFIKKTPSIK